MAWNPLAKIQSLDPETQDAVSKGLLSFGLSVLEANRKGVNPMAAIARGGLLGMKAFENTRDEATRARREQEADERTKREDEYRTAQREREGKMQQVYAQYGTDPERLVQEVQKLDPAAAQQLAVNYANLRSLSAAEQRRTELDQLARQYGGDPQQYIQRLATIDPAAAAQMASAYAQMARAGKTKFSLRPGQGFNEATGRVENFVMTDTGEQRWLGPVADPAAAEQSDPLAPWSGITDPKQRAMTQRKMAEQGQADLQDMRAARVQDRQRVGRVNEFERLMENQNTGGWRRLLPEWAAGFDDEMGSMQAITAKMVPDARAPGSGATSDFDAKMFQRATVGYDKPRAANEMIIRGLKAQDQLGGEELAFRERYLATRGHLNGADEAWTQYLNANPIFDPNSPDEPKLNPNRLSYQDWSALVSGQVRIR